LEENRRRDRMKFGLDEEEQSSRVQVKRRLSAALSRARFETGLTQKELAKKVSIQPAYLSQIETGRRFPSFSLLTKLASALGTQASRLMLEAELQKEGDKGQLVYLLAKFLEQAPDHEKLLSSLKALAAIEVSESLARTRATVVEAKRAATAATMAKVKRQQKQRLSPM